MAEQNSTSPLDDNNPESPLSRFYSSYGARITQHSERLFVDEFLFPLLNEQILGVVPQHPFIDSTGSCRRVDFAIVDGSTRLAFEVDGETYHAEGVIPNDKFDNDLFRQNEILAAGYKLIRFSYSQLQSPQWRPIVMATLRSFLTDHAPTLLGENPVTPNPLQRAALEALDFYRTTLGWKKGLVVLPTGTGKTILSALDVKRVGGKALFVVHRLDILKQSIDAYRKVWPSASVGILTGEVRERATNCDVLFASKDTLRQVSELSKYSPNYFAYIVIDEVHHGQSLGYREIFDYFRPQFMLGMTATPDRLDRKDIFELFDYNNVFEISLQEAIENGYLVPYDYYGLTDDIDYSQIRLQGNHYRVDDLERYLIVPKRNEAILREYLERGRGDKAIGFCVSIKHAERMAAFFEENGITAAAVTSETLDRQHKIAAFRRNEIAVLFTVDLFNEGMDFPNVRVLLFLRPTESKTVFVQQLGRGLRLCTGKDRVQILDFIGNYRRANQVRKWLAKSQHEVVTGQGSTRKTKIEYTYANGCEVHFDATVEQILDSQDEREFEVTQDDLKEAYFALAEQMGRKPSRQDLNASGKYRMAAYLRAFGSWVKFVRSIGEYTEASYHYPQGVHLGHLLSILKIFGGGSREGSHFDDKYIRLRGGYDEGRLGGYQRQVKYKLQAAMELGLLPDDRSYAAHEQVPLTLAGRGVQLYKALKPLLNKLDLNFERDEQGFPSSRMKLGKKEYSKAVRNYLADKPEARHLFMRVFIGMPAVTQMLLFMYRIARKDRIERSTIYAQFFQTPFVDQFCDQEGIEEATEEASKHRCPFLIDVLEACDLLSQDNNSVTVSRFLVSAPTVRTNMGEKISVARRRASLLWEAMNGGLTLPDEEISLVREQFGAKFLTEEYHLRQTEFLRWE